VRGGGYKSLEDRHPIWQHSAPEHRQYDKPFFEHTYHRDCKTQWRTTRASPVLVLLSIAKQTAYKYKKIGKAQKVFRDCSEEWSVNYIPGKRDDYNGY
jgi:hypothetical protein